QGRHYRCYPFGAVQVQGRGQVGVGGAIVPGERGWGWQVAGHQGRPATSRAWGRVNAPAYRALPTIAPSTPAGTRSRRAAMSSRLEMPPEATTGASVRAQTWASRSVFGPRIVPS